MYQLALLIKAMNPSPDSRLGEEGLLEASLSHDRRTYGHRAPMSPRRLSNLAAAAHRRRGDPFARHEDDGATTMLGRHITIWPILCAAMGITPLVDFARLTSHPDIIDRESGFDRLIYLHPDVDLLDLARLSRPCFRIKSNLDPAHRRGFHDVMDTVKAPQVFLCRDSIGPDRPYRGLPVTKLPEYTQFMSVRMRMMLGILEFFMFESHLDYEPELPASYRADHPGCRGLWTTYCPTSHPVGKKELLYAHVYWCPKQGMCIGADTQPVEGDPNMGPREVIPINLDGYLL
ncbi:hypothetical protein EB052_01695 [bacterium]|nr:hypothetical protein [bacterium]